MCPWNAVHGLTAEQGAVVDDKARYGSLCVRADELGWRLSEAPDPDARGQYQISDGRHLAHRGLTLDGVDEFLDELDRKLDRDD